MMRSLAAACFLALFSGPALAGPASDCSGLAQAREQARAVAAPLHYKVSNLDGVTALAFQASQYVLGRDQTAHMTLMINPKTGRTAALLNDGPGCTFLSVFAVTSKPFDNPMDAALDVLALPR